VPTKRPGVETLKSGFGLLRALLPVVYFGSLLFYFLDVGGSVHGAWEIGLGPTVLGLGFVGLLFCIPLALKIIRILNNPRSPGPGGSTPARDDDDGFDADAVVARYMAGRSAETTPDAPAARPAPRSGAPAKPAGFGRRIR